MMINPKRGHFPPLQQNGTHHSGSILLNWRRYLLYSNPSFCIKHTNSSWRTLRDLDRLLSSISITYIDLLGWNGDGIIGASFSSSYIVQFDGSRISDAQAVRPVRTNHIIRFSGQKHVIGFVSTGKKYYCSFSSGTVRTVRLDLWNSQKKGDCIYSPTDRVTSSSRPDTNFSDDIFSSSSNDFGPGVRWYMRT